MPCRYTVQINVSAAITTSDMQWLEQHFGLRGYTPHIGKVDVRCHVADFQYAFPMVSTASQLAFVYGRMLLALSLNDFH